MIRALLVFIAIGCNVSPILLVGPPPDATAPRHRLAVIFGYSQDIGLGVAAEATDQTLQNPFPAVQLEEHYWTGLVFDPYGPRDLAPRSYGMGATYPSGTAGVELSMGRALVAGSNDTWTILKVGASGAGMSFFNLLAIRNLLIGFIQSAMSTFDIESADDVFVVSIEGLIDDGATYQAVLTEFFGATRAAIGNHYIVLDQMHAAPTVETAIIAFGAVTTRTAIVASSDLPTISGGDLHYPINSLDTWGRRGAAAILGLSP